MPLVRFNDSVTIFMGIIRLSISVKEAIILTSFVVLNTPTSYNVIWQRPWIHKMMAILSIDHQLLKYPTVDGMREIKGD